MSLIAAALLDCLRSVERPGDFCVGGTREIFMPAVDVDGVGRIAFPVLPGQVEALVAAAEAAPYGRGAETVVDRDVRRTWQIDPARIRIAGRRWENTLAALVADVAAGLGIGEPVVAEFYKLLVYDDGGFFIDHRDTEKAPGMFATLVIVLPSAHHGGELVVRHLGRETVVLDPRPEEPSEIGFVAFYADCVHEVRPVTAGARLTLVYNLRFPGKRSALKAPDHRTEQGRTAVLLREWATAADEPDKLILPLEHAYTPAALDRLRGRIALPLEAPRDWARANPLGCKCPQCADLGAFLLAPDRAAWRLKAVQDRRTHVEQSVQHAHCDLDLTTERRGSPHTLIATKNQASYERRAKQRQQDLEHVAALGG